MDGLPVLFGAVLGGESVVTWEELLKRVCPLANNAIMERICPGALFGNVAPKFDDPQCIKFACRACWQRQVPPEILKAHGIDELDRLRAVAEAAEKLYALHDGDLEVDDLQKSQEHIDAEEVLFAAVDALEEAKSNE